MDRRGADRPRARRWATPYVIIAAVAGLLTGAPPAVAESASDALDKPDGAIRVAAFNIRLAGGRPGQAINRLRAGDDPDIAAVIEILQRVRPDIVLLSELAHDPANEALALFEAELALGRNGADGLAYRHRFSAPVNTGVQSGFDLDGDGAPGPGDAWGWGVFPGQFGMAVLSALPLDLDATRTFRRLLWRDFAAVDGAENIPRAPDTGAPFYAPEAWAAFPLSSKSHWDVVATLPSGRPLHLLASHPTPPVFDGPEDRNGLRNRAEILFWRHYIDDADWIRDDQGRRGGLEADAAFVVLGDLNADPADGSGRRDAITSLLTHARVQDPTPQSIGGVAAAQDQGGVNASHRGDPARDTADWRDAGDGAAGNLRVDYALPSQNVTVVGAGVFWPAPDTPFARLIEGENGDPRRPLGSDHRLVWVDLRD